MASISSKVRLEKIRINFLFDHPFLSVLALSLPYVYKTNSYAVFETNGLLISVDEDKSHIYSDETLKYQFAHTLLHILLKHPFRMKNRDFKVWNRSCDIAINLLLDQFERVGQRPEDEVLLKKFENKSVEAIYAALYEESQEDENQEDDSQEEEKYDLIDEHGDTAEYEAAIAAVIVQAITAAKQAGNIPASLIDLISEITKPKIDLQTLLHAYMSESFFDKVSDFSRPNRRFIHKGIYLPGYKQEKNRLSLSIALDRSMSITHEVFKQFLGIIDGVIALSSDYMVKVIPFDDQIKPEDISVYDANNAHKEISFAKGNGGTDFSCVTDYLQKNNLAWESNFLIVLSDGFFTIKKMIDIPTIFLISEVSNIERFKPYGDVVRFDL